MISPVPIPLVWLTEALLRLWARDHRLLELGAGETSISARLATHLDIIVPNGWDVDAEYDRQEEAWAQKSRLGKTSTGRDRSMRPDVAVHVRGEQGRENNLLFVELKRQWISGGNEDDHEKAIEAVERIGYAYGVVLGLSQIAPKPDRHAVDRFAPRWTVYAPPIFDQKARMLCDDEAIFSDATLRDIYVQAQVGHSDRAEARRSMQHHLGDLLYST